MKTSPEKKLTEYQESRIALPSTVPGFFVVLCLLVATVFILKGFRDYEIDYLSSYECFPTAWYSVPLVKRWDEKFTDEWGDGKRLCIRRPFRSYVLEYEYVSAVRLNKQFSTLQREINTCSSRQLSAH